MDCFINLIKLQEARSDILIVCGHGNNIVIEHKTNEIICNGKRTGLKPWYSKENMYFSLINIEQYDLNGLSLLEALEKRKFLWNKNKNIS